MARLRIGSRGSQLALWQAHHISDLLRAQGHTVELEIIKTTGDKITDVALAKVGTKGMFTKEIEEALVENRVDLAVHSLKDLPTELAADFEIAAITTRENPRDVFCSVKFAGIEALPQRANVGTSSLRRQAQLKAVRPDLQIHPLRGNVDTRLRKLEAGDYDAIILAAAGLNRLGKTQLVRQVIPAEVMTPAAGQGALGIEIRNGDTAHAGASGISRRRCRPRHHHLRARPAQQTRRRLPGSHRRLRRSYGRPHSSERARSPSRRNQGSARDARGRRSRAAWAKKLAKRFSAEAAMLFSKKFTAKVSHCRNNRRGRSQVSGLRSQEPLV